jgi:glycosyltransferase involved in cell wall biosynthesis
MKILHVSPSFYPTKAYGGTIRSGYGLCRGLAELGCCVRVLTTDSDGLKRTLEVSNDRDVQIDGLRIRYCHKLFRHSTSFELLGVLREYVRWADVVHLTAVYSFPTFPTLSYCRIYRKPLVWSPRGSLQRWGGSTRLLPKYIWERICLCLVLKDELILHTTCEDEASQSSRRFPGIRTVIVHNGVELPNQPNRVDSNGTLRMTYLGRLHPIKGIERLLEACKVLEQLYEPWHLSIAGSGTSAYVDSLKRKVVELGLQGHVEFLGEVHGDLKENLWANSDVTLAPSYAENFGMAIAESLAHAVPVIAGKGTPWRGLLANECGLWVENDPNTLAAAIRRISTMPLREMGQRGRCWMEREFSCQSVSRQMLAVFEECVNANARKS